MFPLNNITNNKYAITYLGTKRISVAEIRIYICPLLGIGQSIAARRSNRSIKSSSSSSDVTDGSVSERPRMGGGAWTGGGRPRNIRNGRFVLQLHMQGALEAPVGKNVTLNDH